MPTKKTTKPKANHAQKKRPPSRARRRSAAPKMTRETKLEILAVILVAVALLTIISLFSGEDAGIVSVWRAALAVVFGWGIILIALGLLLAAGFLFREALNKETILPFTMPLGGVVASFALLGVLDSWSEGPLGYAAPTRGGGVFGGWISSMFQAVAGGTGSAIILWVIFIIGLMLVFRISMAQLLVAFKGLGSQIHQLVITSANTAPIQEEERRRPQPRPTVAGGNGQKPEKNPEELSDGILEPEPVAEAPAEPIVNTMVDWKEAAQEPKPAEAKAAPAWRLPDYDMLAKSSPAEINREEMLKKAKIIEDTLGSFNVAATVREVNSGPTVTQFALEPGSGVKVAKITSLSNDLALALAAPSIRIEAPVPGQSRVGIEIPNAAISVVGLRDVMESSAFQRVKGRLRIALGRDVSGQSMVADLAKMPHLLIAGATGSGKSVCINSVIASLLFHCTPLELRFLMVDPKMVELAPFDGVPHLLAPVVTDLKKVVGVLQQAVAEMERRYDMFAREGFRNIDTYNRRANASNGKMLPLPFIVIIIDELADLMMVAPDQVETLICRLAQMARAVGIHLVLATQRPSVDVVTGLIKANFPSRISFAVTSQIDSRVILDMAGAEKLLGRGDMLFTTAEMVKPVRVQGTYVSDGEIEALVGFWKGIYEPQYEKEFVELPAYELQEASGDKLLPEAIKLVRQHNTASVSMLQRRLRVGYNRAASIMDQLEEKGIVALGEDGRTWEVMIEEDDLAEE